VRPPVDVQPPAAWLADLERRHLADLRLSEVSRALRALSSTYVERRQTALSGGRALDGAGKRAAFALYYGPLHFMTATAILDGSTENGARSGEHGERSAVIDVGCGTGAVGAAVAAWLSAPSITGLDTHPWALAEARHTYAAFGLATTLHRGSAGRLRRPRGPAFIVAGYVANELPEVERDRLLEVLVESARHGGGLLVVEPLARSLTPWWSSWVSALAPLGAATAEWKLHLALPDIVRRLGTAAGLTAGAVNARSLLRWPG
jgi:SAM-dependent methyltransferase